MLTDYPRPVTCGACGYTTDEVYAVGGALLDGRFFEVTVACPKGRRLVDAPAGSLSDYSWIEDDGTERELTAEDVDTVLNAEEIYTRDGQCPVCDQVHPAWDAAIAACPVCGARGCRVEDLDLQTQVLAIELDGRSLGPSSMASATLRTAGDQWTVLMVADWGSDVMDRIRREGVISAANVSLKTAAGRFTSRAKLEYRSEPASGRVEVLMTGLEGLTPKSL